MAKLSYEKALKDLEDIFREIESGELPLEKSLKKFEDGVKLSRYCTKMLDEAEQKITILLKDEDGNISEEEMRIEK